MIMLDDETLKRTYVHIVITAKNVYADLQKNTIFYCSYSTILWRKAMDVEILVLKNTPYSEVS